MRERELVGYFVVTQACMLIEVGVKTQIVRIGRCFSVIEQSVVNLGLKYRYGLELRSQEYCSTSAVWMRRTCGV